MARTVVRVEGLRECEQALTELIEDLGASKATGANVLKRVLTRAGQPIASAAQAAAPVRKGRLKLSIKVGTKLSRRQKAQHVKESTVEVFVGAGPLPHAHMQEFGTARHPAKPFMRPAWDGHKMEALEIIKRDLADEIAKAAARQRRKLARLA